MAVVGRWPFKRGLNKSQCLDGLPKKGGRYREVAIVETWLLVKL